MRIWAYIPSMGPARPLRRQIMCGSYRIENLLRYSMSRKIGMMENWGGFLWGSIVALRTFSNFPRSSSMLFEISRRLCLKS